MIYFTRIIVLDRILIRDLCVNIELLRQVITT